MKTFLKNSLVGLALGLSLLNSGCKIKSNDKNFTERKNCPYQIIHYSSDGKVLSDEKASWAYLRYGAEKVTFTPCGSSKESVIYGTIRVNKLE